MTNKDSNANAERLQWQFPTKYFAHLMHIKNCSFIFHLLIILYEFT